MRKPVCTKAVKFEERGKEALRLGSKWVDTDRLFVKWNGAEMNNQTPYGWLKEFCEKNDLPFYGLHSSRHFAASALISAGLDVTKVSGTSGHTAKSCQIRQRALPPKSSSAHFFEFRH